MDARSIQQVACCIIECFQRLMFLEFIKFSFLFVWFAMEIRINVVEIEPEQIRRCSYIYINDTHRVRSLVVVNKPETTEYYRSRSMQVMLHHRESNKTKHDDDGSSQHAESNVHCELHSIVTWHGPELHYNHQWTISTVKSPWFIESPNNHGYASTSIGIKPTHLH